MTPLSARGDASEALPAHHLLLRICTNYYVIHCYSHCSLHYPPQLGENGQGASWSLTCEAPTYVTIPHPFFFLRKKKLWSISSSSSICVFHSSWLKKNATFLCLVTFNSNILILPLMKLLYRKDLTCLRPQDLMNFLIC